MIELAVRMLDEVRAMTKKKEGSPMSGQVSLFRGKVRKPVSITLTPDHHAKVLRARRRLGLTRSDLIGLLIDQFADTVRI